MTTRKTVYMPLDDLTPADRNRIVKLIDDRGPGVCHPWLGTLSAKGYPQISIGPRGSARSVRVTRIVLGWKLGRDLTDDEQSCHTCDYPRCCNEDHLFLGSAADNQHDKAAKGRAAKGESNGAHVLTEVDVRRIRQSSGSFTAIGREFGVSRVTIAKILRGDAWSHVA